MDHHRAGVAGQTDAEVTVSVAEDVMSSLGSGNVRWNQGQVGAALKCPLVECCFC